MPGPVGTQSQSGRTAAVPRSLGRAHVTPPSVLEVIQTDLLSRQKGSQIVPVETSSTGQGLPIAAMLEGEPTGAMPAMSRGDASRVERLEHQVDQMAQQMERISESQDFISRVLTDRIEQLPDPRMRTPR